MDTKVIVVGLLAGAIFVLVIVYHLLARRAKNRQRSRLISEEVRKLQSLKDTLLPLPELGDPLVEILYFFDAVSCWHDRGLADLIVAFKELNSRQYDGVLEKLETLQKHFVNAGRDPYGWNRTKKGERVTADSVFLGDIYGLFTHPVTFWMERKDEPKDQWQGGLWGDTLKGKNSYDVVSDQARKFMVTHIGQMVAIIDDLGAITV